MHVEACINLMTTLSTLTCCVWNAVSYQAINIGGRTHRDSMLNALQWATQKCHVYMLLNKCNYMIFMQLGVHLRFDCALALIFCSISFCTSVPTASPTACRILSHVLGSWPVPLSPFFHLRSMSMHFFSELLWSVPIFARTCVCMSKWYPTLSCAKAIRCTTLSRSFILK